MRVRKESRVSYLVISAGIQVRLIHPYRYFCSPPCLDSKFFFLGRYNLILFHRMSYVPTKGYAGVRFGTLIQRSSYQADRVYRLASS